MPTNGLIFVGEVTRPHGVRGELKVLEGEGASGAWKKAEELYIGDSPEDAVGFRVAHIRGGGQFAILCLAEVGTRDRAEELKGKRVYVRREQLPPLEEGAFYAGDLLGMEVVDTCGCRLGSLQEIFDNGAHEIYAVRDGSREILLPILEGVVVTIDCAAGRIVVDPPAGLPGLDPD